MYLEICSLIKAGVPESYNITCSISCEPLVRKNNMAMLQPNMNSANRGAGCVDLVVPKLRTNTVQSLELQ
jgi:hypothetical protein